MRLRNDDVDARAFRTSADPNNGASSETENVGNASPSSTLVDSATTDAATPRRTSNEIAAPRDIPRVPARLLAITILVHEKNKKTFKVYRDTIKNVSRYRRLHEIERILLEHTDGISRSELARRLGVHRSTIGRDIDYLSPMIAISESDDHKISIDRNDYLTTVRLTMFELEALHLAARLFARVMRFPFPHASEALRKLADAQGRVSPRLAERIRATAEEITAFATRLSAEPTRYRRHVEKLGIAITENRTVIVRHFSRNHREVRSYRLIPITLEPHHEGRAVHLVGWDLDSVPPAFRTLKIERIREIQLRSPEPDLLTDIPVESLRERLSRAWGIWATDGEPVPVTLRFSRNVADRVAETIWHESQEIVEASDGSLMWHGKIAEPREMYPWIRGWGPDVEVIEPDWLRERHREDFEKGVELYGGHTV